MTTIVPFAQQVNSVFSFQAVLDGQSYTVSVPWNLAGQRWYCLCAQLDGTPVFLLPLIGSPTGVAVQGMSWANQTAMLTTILPHGYQIGMTINLTISGCAPDGFNGQFPCLISGPSTISYPLSTDPGQATAFGIVNYNINMAQGYFTTSALVFRQAAQQFEISP